MAKASKITWRLLGAALLLGAAGTAAAQADNFPNKPVRIIVPYAPGGASDSIARSIIDFLSKDMGQSFIVDNRAGGNTVIGTNAVAKAPPDGYTLLATTEAFWANHYLQADLTYDSLKELTMVVPLGRSESILAVNPAVPANNLKEFIAYAKANPGKLNVAVTSTVGVLHLSRLSSETGAKFTIVNYNGGAPALTDLVAGNVQFAAFNILVVLPMIQAGKLKGLAISGDKRDAGFPNIPTFSEEGVKTFTPGGPGQYPLLAPIKTPKPVMEKINASVRKVEQDPEVLSRLGKIRVSPVVMNLAQSEQLFKSEIDRYGEMVKASGLQRGQAIQ